MNAEVKKNSANFYERFIKNGLELWFLIWYNVRRGMLTGTLVLPAQILKLLGPSFSVLGKADHPAIFFGRFFH